MDTMSGNKYRGAGRPSQGEGCEWGMRTFMDPSRFASERTGITLFHTTTWNVSHNPLNIRKKFAEGLFRKKMIQSNFGNFYRVIVNLCRIYR